MTAHLDMMCRLQILEGVAQQQPNSWSRGGIKEARAFFAHSDIHPEWLSEKDTVFYRRLRRLVSEWIVPAKGHLSADDVLQDLLASLGSQNQKIKSTLNTAGRSLSSQILKGQVSPQDLLSETSLLVTWVRRKCLNHSTRAERQEEVFDEYAVLQQLASEQPEQGTVPSMRCSASSGRDPLEVATDIFFDRENPLGQGLRRYLRDTFPGRGTRAKMYWAYLMTYIEEHGEVPSWKQMAEHFGVPSPSIYRIKHHFDGYLRRLERYRPDLYNELVKAFDREGVT